MKTLLADVIALVDRLRSGYGGGSTGEAARALRARAASFPAGSAGQHPGREAWALLSRQAAWRLRC